MKSKHKKQNKIIPVILVIIGLAAVAGIVFVALKLFGLERLFNNTEEPIVDPMNTAKPIVAEPQNTPEKPEDNNKPQDTPDENTFKEKEPIVNYSGDDPNASEVISGAITYTGLSNDTLNIRVNIDQYIEEGTCMLTLSGPRTSYVEAARVIDSAATATCEGFNVPLTVIKDDRLEIIIEIHADNKHGHIRGEATL